jgi:hypothetical protein
MRGINIRPSIGLVALAISLLPFSSCTCQSETPEPPAKVAAKPGGFGAMVTPRKAPQVVEAQITPNQVTPLGAPTIGPTPDQSKIPDNFPEGVPVPEGAKVMAVQTLANNARSVIFATEGETPELFNLYKNTMSGSGWGKPTQEYQGKEQSFLSFKKGETITNISVTKDPRTGKRVIAVMYYDEKPLPFAEF